MAPCTSNRNPNQTAAGFLLVACCCSMQYKAMGKVFTPSQNILALLVALGEGHSSFPTTLQTPPGFASGLVDPKMCKSDLQPSHSVTPAGGKLLPALISSITIHLRQEYHDDTLLVMCRFGFWTVFASVRTAETYIPKLPELSIKNPF